MNSPMRPGILCSNITLTCQDGAFSPFAKADKSHVEDRWPVFVTCQDQEVPPKQALEPGVDKSPKDFWDCWSKSNESPKAEHTFSLVSFWDSCRSTLCQATPKKRLPNKNPTPMQPPEALVVGLS